MITANERQAGIRFDLVSRSRPDLAVMHPVSASGPPVIPYSRALYSRAHVLPYSLDPFRCGVTVPTCRRHPRYTLSLLWTGYILCRGK